MKKRSDFKRFVFVISFLFFFTLSLSFVSAIHNITIYETPSTTTTTTEDTSGGGSIVPIYTPQVSQLEEGYTKSLSQNWQINFNIEGSSHKLKVDKIENL